MRRQLWLAMGVMAVTVCGTAMAAGNPYVGNWALTIPGNHAGWLGVTEEKGYLDASILWGGGSVVPVSSAYMDGDTLVVTRTRDVERKDASGAVVAKQAFTDVITAKVSGDTLALTLTHPDEKGGAATHSDFTGKRIPPLPAAPDLSKVKYGKTFKLFNGKNLDGWELTDPGAVNGWSAKKGLLVNEPAQQEGQPRKHYGNLRTKKEFEDFNLKCEVMVPKDGNSGIYLRGVYEVQVVDSFGKPTETHTMGSIYSRIAPSTAAEKAPGEWQTVDITLCDRHVTVKLNGKTVIDNQALLGCTGGALTSDEFRPGPIYLQGDHTGVTYRNVSLRPIVKK